jgi:PAS domain S-box-containing protein
MRQTSESSNEAYNALFEKTRVAMLMVNSRGVIVSVNAAFARLLGCPKSAIKNRKRWTDLMRMASPDLATNLRGRTQVKKNGKSSTHLGFVIDCQGNPCPVLLTFFSMAEDGLSLVSVMEKRQDEKDARLFMEQRFFYDSVCDIVFIANDDGAIRSANHVAVQLYGYSKYCRLC